MKTELTIEEMHALIDLLKVTLDRSTIPFHMTGMYAKILLKLEERIKNNGI